MGCPGQGRTSCLTTDNLPFWQNATLMAEKAALQGQLQHLEGQLGSLQGRAQELLLQSQRAQEHTSRLQVGGSQGPHPLPVCVILCPFPSSSQVPHLFLQGFPSDLSHCRLYFLPFLVFRIHICTHCHFPSPYHLSLLPPD